MAAAADQARAAALKTREEALQLARSMKQKSPGPNKLLKIVAVLTAGVDLLAVGGAAAAAAGLTLLLATPIFLLLSPVLVPLAIVAALATSGFIAASAAFVVFCSLATWVFNYVKGKRPVGADKLDAIKARIANAASAASNKASEAIHHSS